MIVTLDTNVLVSGALSAIGPSGKLLDLWRAGTLVLALSPWIIDEADRTLHEPYFLQRLGEDTVARFLDLLLAQAAVVEPTVSVTGIATHPEDDQVLAAATSAGANYLVTGDKQLQRLGSYQGVTILSPSAFLSLLEESRG